MHYAIKNCQIDTGTIRMLLEHKADPRRKNSDGNTPLHLLITENPGNVLAAIQLLLAAGADPNAKNKDGETPLKLALDANYQLIAVVSKLPGELKEQYDDLLNNFKHNRL